MLTRHQIEAMDDMRDAQIRADAACLQHESGVVDEPYTAVLIRRISTRQNLLAHGPLTEKARRRLEDANECDAQQLALIEDAEAAPDMYRFIGLVPVLVIVAVVIISVIASHNWPMPWGQ